jgi:hypothetical protein
VAKVIKGWDKAVSGWKDSIGKENFKLFKLYQRYANPWQVRAKKMEDARYGKHFSTAETKELLAFRQAPLPISVSSAISDTADALMVSSQPSVHVSPIIYIGDEEKNTQSQQVSQVFSQLIEKDWFDSLGNLQFDRAVKDSGNVGHGLLYTVPRTEFGEFSVDVKHLSWRYFFPDPASKDPLYRDMDNMVYAIKVSLRAAFKIARTMEPGLTLENFKENFVAGQEELLGDLKEDSTYGYTRKGNDTTEDVIFINRPQLEEEIIYVAVPIGEDKLRLGVRTFPTITSELLELEQTKQIRIVQKKRFILSEYISIGKLGKKKKYPITKYNIVPLPYDHRDNPYPYSRMWQLYPLQRALNKFMMSAVLNQSLMNSTRVLAEEGSIVNMKDWIMSSSMPGSILQYKLPIPGSSTPPQIIQAQPMNEAWLTMPKYLTSMMEYISGIFGVMMGNSEGSSDVFSTVASLQSAGGLKIKRRMAHADATLSVLGEVMGEYYKEYAPINGFSTSYDATTGKDNVIAFNTSKVDMTDGKPKVRIDPNDDLSTGFRRVRFTSQSTGGYESATEAALLTQLATTMNLPDLVPMILERINIRNSGKAIESMDRAKQLEGQVQQDQEVIKELESKTKQYQNQIFQLGKTLEQAKFKGKLAVEMEKFTNDPVGYMEQSLNNQGER